MVSNTEEDLPNECFPFATVVAEVLGNIDFLNRQETLERINHIKKHSAIEVEEEDSELEGGQVYFTLIMGVDKTEHVEECTRYMVKHLLDAGIFEFNLYAYANNIILDETNGIYKAHVKCVGCENVYTKILTKQELSLPEITLKCPKCHFEDSALLYDHNEN